MTESYGSTVSRRILGRELRGLREGSGVPMMVACAAIEVSPQTMWRLEGGQGVKLTEHYIRTLCALYRASEEDTTALLGLLKETKRTGWWHAYDDLVPSYFNLYLGLEEIARRLTTFHPLVLPGLLQTEGYRRAIIWGSLPGMPTLEVERRIEIAGRRQARLREQPAKFSMRAFLAESALRYRVGGPGVMADQLRHIAGLSSMPTVTIRILPSTCENPLPLIAGPFTLMEFPADGPTKFNEPPVVYVEGYTGALYLDKPTEIVEYRSALRVIESAALSEQDTRELVTEMAEELE